jgi:hypothetical protein
VKQLEGTDWMVEMLENHPTSDEIDRRSGRRRGLDRAGKNVKTSPRRDGCGVCRWLDSLHAPSAISHRLHERAICAANLEHSPWAQRWQAPVVELKAVTPTGLSFARVKRTIVLSRIEAAYGGERRSGVRPA